MAQPADTTLTLACKGTTTSGVEDAKPEPISMGIIVNFTNRTVHGFGHPVKIDNVNEVKVEFGFGDSTPLGGSTAWGAVGSIDRVTGDVEATSIMSDVKTGKIVTSTSYSLKCRPAQRMF